MVPVVAVVVAVPFHIFHARETCTRCPYDFQFIFSLRLWFIGSQRHIGPLQIAERQSDMSTSMASSTSGSESPVEPSTSGSESPVELSTAHVADQSSDAEDGQTSESHAKTVQHDVNTSDSDGTTSESQGKTSESDGTISESGGKTPLPDTDGTTSESGGKTPLPEIDGTTSGSDGKTSQSDGNTSESDGKTSASPNDQPRLLDDANSFMVWELACHPQSTLSAVAEKVGLQTRRLTLETGWDLSLVDSQRRALVLARRENPRKIWVSLPCTAWSSMQNANRRTSLQRTRLMLARHHSRQCLSVCLPICEQVVEQGGHFYFEWPAHCHGWKVVELLRFIGALEGKNHTLYRCRIDGCAYGLKNGTGTHFLRKPWLILTNDFTMYQTLNKRCPRNHPHVRIGGQETSRSAYYPIAMAATAVLVWVRLGG